MKKKGLYLPPSDTFEERKRKNTICFEPDYSPADLRIQFGFGVWPKFPYEIKENDVIIVPAVSDEEAKELFGNFKKIKPYLRYTKV